MPLGVTRHFPASTPIKPFRSQQQVTAANLSTNPPETLEIPTNCSRDRGPDPASIDFYDLFDPGLRGRYDDVTASGQSTPKRAAHSEKLGHCIRFDCSRLGISDG